MIASENEIHHFLEMYSIRHFTQAAMKLRVTQSALTQSISKLEGKVGAPLFYRTKKGCTPTHAGDIFYQQAQGLLESWSLITQKIKFDQQSVAGKFRLGCHPSLAIYALPGLLKRLRENSPAIEVILFHDFSKNLTEKVISYELDLALVVNPSRHKDLILSKIYGDRVCLWKSKSRKDIPQEIFTDKTRMELKSFFGKRWSHFQDWKITSSTSLELVRALTVEGLGLGVLPERVAEVDGKKLDFYDRSLSTPLDEIFAIHRYDTLKTQAGRQLKDTLRVCFQ